MAGIWSSDLRTNGTIPTLNFTLVDLRESYHGVSKSEWVTWVLCFYLGARVGTQRYLGDDKPMKGDSHCLVEMRTSPGTTVSRRPGPPITCFTHRRPQEVKPAVGPRTAPGGPEAGRPEQRGPDADAPKQGLRVTHRCGREGRCAAGRLPVAGEVEGGVKGDEVERKGRRRGQALRRGGGDRDPASFLLGQIPGPSPPAPRRPA